VYGFEAIFPYHLALPVEKIFQDYQGELDDMIRRIQQLVLAHMFVKECFPLGIDPLAKK
jgi:hypothetical protein